MAGILWSAPFDRLYFALARTPEMQVEASAWNAARHMEVVTSAVAARIVGRKAAAAAAAATRAC